MNCVELVIGSNYLNNIRSFVVFPCGPKESGHLAACDTQHKPRPVQACVCHGKVCIL